MMKKTFRVLTFVLCTLTGQQLIGSVSAVEELPVNLPITTMFYTVHNSTFASFLNDTDNAVVTRCPYRQTPKYHSEHNLARPDEPISVIPSGTNPCNTLLQLLGKGRGTEYLEITTNDRIYYVKLIFDAMPWGPAEKTVLLSKIIRDGVSYTPKNSVLPKPAGLALLKGYQASRYAY